MQTHGRQPKKTGLQCIFQLRFHCRHLLFTRLHLAIGSIHNAHRRHAHITVTDKRNHIRPQRLLVDKLNPLTGFTPGFFGLQNRQHFFARYGFDTGKDIRGVFRITADHTQRTAAHQHSGNPMTNRLGETWRDQYFGIIVGVGVKKTRCHPFAASVDNPRLALKAEGFSGDAGNNAIFNANVLNR